jgi:hypothetical protein
MSLFDRDADKISIGEHRIYMASVSGPKRIVCGGGGRMFPIAAAGPPVMVAQNQSGYSMPLYVELRPPADAAAPTLLLAGEAACDISQAVTLDLSVAPFFFGQVLLPGERLWVRNPSAQLAVRFMVYQVTV